MADLGPAWSPTGRHAATYDDGAYRHDMALAFFPSLDNPPRHRQDQEHTS
jgi:hypothetical protein